MNEENGPFEHLSDDELEERRACLRDMAGDRGYVLLQWAVEEQYRSLLGRLVRSNDHDEILRTQGAVRALGDMLETADPEIHGTPLRARLMAEIKYVLDERKGETEAEG